MKDALSKFAPAGLEDALNYYQELFFHENYPHARFIAGDKNSRLNFIQNRFAQGIGVSTNNVDWHASNQDIATQLWETRSHNFLNESEWKLFINHANIAEPLFKEILPNTQRDVTRTYLRNAVNLYEKLGIDSGIKISHKLAGLVDTIFARGYPELYDIDVINVSYTEFAKLDRSQCKLVGASPSEQNDTARRITDLIAKTDFSEKAQSLFWKKVNDKHIITKEIVNHLNKYHRDVYGEHKAVFSDSERKKIRGKLVGLIIGNTIYGAAASTASVLMNSGNDVLLISIIIAGIIEAGKSTKDLIESGYLLIRGRPKRGPFSVGFSKERATAYKECTNDVEII